jgi:hypothetical protein
MSVLVVEDDPDIRDFVADALSIDGYAVLTAGNGLEALRLLDEQRPDVVLLDLRMPVMDGPTFARRCWERCMSALSSPSRSTWTTSVPSWDSSPVRPPERPAHRTFGPPRRKQSLDCAGCDPCDRAASERPRDATALRPRHRR